MRASGLLLVILLAACATPSPPDASWAQQALPFGEGHDHADPAHHLDRSTDNFEVLGFTPFSSDHYGGVAGGYLCGDAQEIEGGRRLAVIESRSDVGFALVDVTEPATPRVLGELVMPTTYIYDVAVVLDGQHVVLATAGTDNIPPGLPIATPTPVSGTGLQWRDACGTRPVDARGPTDDVPRPMNLVLVDISDPSAPAIVDDQPLFGFGHSIFPTILDGRPMLLVTTAGGYTGLVGAPTSGYFLYEVLDTPAGGRLALVSSFFPPDEAGLPVVGPRGHDGWIHEHPATGMTLGYLAGASRLTLVDMDDPMQPTEVGRWEVPVSDSFLHGAFPLPELWDGRHYTVVGPEYCNHPADTPTGIAYVLDTTDPAAPFAVAAWTLPHEVEWDGCYMFSNHYFTVVGDTLFMSLYHGGIWAIDLGPVRAWAPGDPLLSLPSIGVFLPADDTLPEPAEPVRWAPTIEEVLAMPDGTLVTFDGNYGLYTLAFDATRPAPSPAPWPL